MLIFLVDILGEDRLPCRRWIIAFYQLAFGLIMITLEIQGEWVEKSAQLLKTGPVFLKDARRMNH